MIGLINQICFACDAKQREREPERQPVVLLEELEHLTKAHFDHEEAVLRDLSKATLNHKLRETLSAAGHEHAAEHVKRLGDLREMRRALHSDEFATEAKLCADLTVWFIDHAIVYEAQVKTIIRSA
jgi:hemerythrin